MSLATRVHGEERMDAPDVDPAELDRSLADLRRVNRWLGGTRVVVHHLTRLLAGTPPGPVEVLDVATGSGDVPRTLVEWGRSRGRAMRVVATDVHAGTLAHARRYLHDVAGVRVEAADARDLPYDDGSFDIALCSTALHHFRDDDAVRVVHELARVSRIGFIVNDLERSRGALWGVRLLAATVWRSHPVTRHDGPLSVRRSFTARELRDLARRAGVAHARVHRHLPFRLALVGSRGGG